ncbi:class I SAM-dependent methyltransferase [Psychrobacillus lasiicapitis]|uniref:Class I SAM-dependent methyltransferase n=1 Tax=Psychrobacillus lasiicapitis TaxID=1636719 RepID=A0A544TGW3_9BACI|nr:class I SAM-dependent methyltransferase [Psychrobacillus lasiicapitis]TQR16650.1 class I SAM-dependent methyltransferase [Psychrobacillus lasiicapitis]GGA28365.1 ubiquinone biosynthesis methyltransferase UbiE [Psychrobacillus lasiicapitis]
MNDKVKEAYNQLANDYEHNVDTKSLFNTEYERPAMMKLLPTDVRDKHVLDAGCAAGWYTSQFVNLGAVVTATDISPKMVEATKRRIGEKAEVFCLDLEKELPFENESFDVIVSSLVLHYIKDWSNPFSEFLRILKPNGTLLFSVHHPFMDIKLSENGDYFSTEYIVDQWKREGKLIDVPFYRRPLQEILSETISYFSLEKIVEPQPTKEFQVKEPEKYEKLMRNPHFFIVKAVKDK